jgi:hypothetical protein
MTGRIVTGDLEGLAAGRAVDLRLTATVTITDNAHPSAQVPEDEVGRFLRPELNRPLPALIRDLVRARKYEDLLSRVNAARERDRLGPAT